MMSVMLQSPSARASTASSSSFQPVSRTNTNMSSHEGSGARSVRQSKRYSMTTLYLSMSAQKEDLEIEDDLAKGSFVLQRNQVISFTNQAHSAKNITRAQDEDLVTVQEEFCAGKRRTIP